ncbi:MAG: hypothetical protein M3281_01185 [Chloroflexota bacterium]|nr:hypothetical protein [Chloroflexota bacterium]
MARSVGDPSLGGFPPHRDWEEQLWVLCETLGSSPCDLVTAISGSGTLAGAWETASLLLLSERLADEFGLRVTTEIDRDTFTVRFSRASRNNNYSGVDSALLDQEQAGGLALDAER